MASRHTGHLCGSGSIVTQSLHMAMWPQSKVTTSRGLVKQTTHVSSPFLSVSSLLTPRRLKDMRRISSKSLWVFFCSRYLEAIRQITKLIRPVAMTPRMTEKTLREVPWDWNCLMSWFLLSRVRKYLVPSVWGGRSLTRPSSRNISPIPIKLVPTTSISSVSWIPRHTWTPQQAKHFKTAAHLRTTTGNALQNCSSSALYNR